MQNTREPETDIDAALQDISDFERFFSDADEDLTEADMDLLAAAGNYAAFRSRLGLDDDTDDEQ